MMDDILREVRAATKEVVKEVSATLRGISRSMRPPRRVRMLPPAEQLRRYYRLTPEDKEKLRQQWGDEVYKAYIHAMATLMERAQRGEL